MIRIAHTAGLALLVAVVLVAYGVKEETRALLDERNSLIATLEAKHDEIATLKAEWEHRTSPSELKRLAVRLFGEGRILGADGEPLEPLRAGQVLDLGRPDPETIATGEIRKDDAGATAGE